jgi:NADH-quinone oxidoreductase subunit N
LGSGVNGLDVILFYLVAYGAMTVGAFGVLAYLSTPERPVETVDDLAGLSRSHPGVALLMAVFLFSLLGMPLTAGFWGKLFLFWGAMTLFTAEHGSLFITLAVIGALNAAIGAWYYLRVLVRMYLHAPLRPLPPARSWPGLATLWVCAAVTLAFGVYPGPLLEATHKAVTPERSASLAVGAGEQARR